ncbi:hypothetical protein AAHA92_29242 [Salvia divinorum]|uniref:Retrotransposon gag domain-containing protein n=1 Tax=Salvia divinorum TaxID=28513 RepID=A0ABD1G0B5_SALDI
MRTRSGKEILEPFDPEIERSCRKKKSSESEMATISQEDMALLVRQVQLLVDDKAAREETERRNRGIVPVMQMFNYGNVVTIPTIPRINANNFELNSAKEWFGCLPVDKISSWDDIVALFLDKYYPPGTILKLKSEICQFIQGHDEPLYEAVARFKALLRKCLNHGFSIEYQVGLLYNGFTEHISSMLDAGANGGFLMKGEREVMEVIEEFASNSRGWSKERHNMKRVASIKNKEDIDLAKGLAALRARMDKIDNTQRDETTPPTSVISLALKDAPPTVGEVNYVQNGGGPNRPYNNYRPSQGGGFNVSQGGVVEPPKEDERERYEQGIQRILEAMQEDRKANDTKIGVVEARLNNLEVGLNTLVTTVTAIKTQMDQIQKQEEDRRAKAADRVNELNKEWVAKRSKDEASTSGTKNEDTDAASGPLDESQRPLEKSQRAAGRESVADSTSHPAQHNGIVIPFPSRQKLKLEEQFKHFLHKFCKLHINLPLIDALQEIPRYASLLREAVMTKHKLKKNDLKLPRHCSDIIQKHRAVKQRDPGQVIIRCSIGKGKADKALCDLGAGINIMPLEYYEKLNIGPLKATGVCIRLVDNSTTQAVGIVEDVLVKIDGFIFPADFFVLDMDVDKDVPLILGRNFLATCKALIDVGRGEITISDSRRKSTYQIERAMIKDEEAKRINQEEELKMVMMTNKSKPLAAQRGEDYSKPSIFIVTPPSTDKKQKVSKQPRSPFQERTRRGPKPLHLMDAEVYVIKMPNGKYKWWKKIYNKLVPYAVAATRVVDPPT